MTARARSRRKAPRTLYLVRHAIAATRGDAYPDDRVRPLTREGAARMRRAARGFARLDPGLDLVLTSPLVRAHRTAEILVSALKPAPKLEVLKVLEPGHAPAEIAAALSAYAGSRAIALVGHEPDLGLLAAWLTGAREPLEFKKGGIARFEIQTLPPGRDSRLRWFATPGMRERSGRGQGRFGAQSQTPGRTAAAPLAGSSVPCPCLCLCLPSDDRAFDAPRGR
jgi:phosphohistidine phosphatase